MKPLPSLRIILPIVGLFAIVGISFVTVFSHNKPLPAEYTARSSATATASASDYDKAIARAVESAHSPAPVQAPAAQAVSADPAPAAAPSKPVAGEYASYDVGKLAKANTGKVVIFFAATWCETCQALDANIRASVGQIPPNTTILNANYDTQQQLKQRYGVTFQHTLVQVDAQGNLLKKWNHSPTLDALVGQII